MQKIKKCYKCKSLLSISLFNVNKARKDGYQTSCKNCQAKANRIYYKKNKKRCINVIRLNKRKRALENHIKIITKYFNKPCVDCNKIYHPSSLVFDHVKNKSEGVGSLVRSGYAWSVIKKEIDKCQVRCQNCHFLKTSRQFNHWVEVSDLIDKYYESIKEVSFFEKHWNFLPVDEFKKEKGQITKKFKKKMIKRITNVITNDREKIDKV